MLLCIRCRDLSIRWGLRRVVKVIGTSLVRTLPCCQGLLGILANESQPVVVGNCAPALSGSIGDST